MILAIDVGNTNVVFAIVEGRAIKSRWRVATDARRTADEYAVWLLQLMAGQPPVEWGFTADIDEPRSLGADRAVNAIAAHDAHPGDLIVVDFGTATTFDAIDYAGTYKGG